MNPKEAALRRAWVPGCANDRSVLGFRIRHGNAKGPMTKHAYYKLKREGRGPRESNGLITVQAEAEWDRAQAAKPAEARLIEREQEVRRQRARAAALQRKASIAKREREASKAKRGREARA